MCVCVGVYVFPSEGKRRTARNSREMFYFFYFLSLPMEVKIIFLIFSPFFFPPPPSHSKTVYNQPVIDCTNEIACYNLG